MHLLTPNGWCQDINFPALKEPIVNPGVYVFEESRNKNIILIVCGFADDNCQWTHSGAAAWYGLQVPSSPYGTSTTKNFQILALDDQNLSMMSIMKDDDSKGRTHNISQAFPAEPEFITDFDQDIHVGNILHKKNMTGSCYAKSGEELILSGGRTPMLGLPENVDFRTEYSHASVGGSFRNQFWADNINELNEAREDHACLGTSSGVIVGGGNNYKYKYDFDSNHANFLSRSTYETLASVEILEDNVWIFGPSFKTARQDFGMVEICEDLLAIGGRIYEGEYLLHRKRLCCPTWWEETITDTIQETFLDSIEILGRFSWAEYDRKLPIPMSSFGVAKAPSSICKSV